MPTPPTPPVLPDPVALYDSIMGKIEPDLVTLTLPTLREKYKDETPEQAAARAERYVNARAEYDRQYAAAIMALSSGVHTFRRESIASLETDDRSGDDSRLRSIEESLSASA